MPEVRLIDANELKRLIQSGDDLIFDAATERELLYMIDYQPTIEAEPARQGNGCEYCDGREYSEKPLTVITVGGRRIELAFEYCPKCGRKLRED
jgi:hypothetical protein